MNLEKTVKKYRELFKSKPAVTTAHEPKGHFYVSPNTTEKYHSVTYFSSTLKDPSLANWKASRALDYVRNHWTEFSPETLEKHLEQAKLSPEDIFQNAGFVGSATHKFMEDYFRAWIDSGYVIMPETEIDSWKLPEDVSPEVISGCRAIKKFLKETGAIPIAVELPLVDDELKVGGQIDVLMVFPNPIKTEVEDPVMGKGYKTTYKPFLAFIDLKTSSQGTKPGYGFQVRGFYQRMIWKTFKVKPKKTYILHTSKDNGTYKLIDLTEMKFLEQDVKHLVELSRSWDRVTEAFKPKVKII